MAEGSGDLLFVSEISVEGDCSDKDVVSILRKSLGIHQTVHEAFNEKAKGCFVVGKIVEIKNSSPLNDVQKLIIREVTSEGCDGSIFALFALGKVATNLKQFSVKVGEIIVIHQPVVSKSCLTNFSKVQSHAYDLQVIVNPSLKSKDRTSPEVVLQLIRRKVAHEFLGVCEPHSEDPPVVKNLSRETEENTKTNSPICKTPQKPEVKIKKLFKQDECLQLNKSPALLKVYPRHNYTKLGEITPSCTKVNIMGVITFVENGCQCMEDKQHLLIYLQDESSSGKNFVLNLGSCTSEIPPLHKTYIIRALNVMILSEDNEVKGWVSSGKMLATVDSDCEKAVTLLTVKENCTLTEDDEERILELRNFVKFSLSLDDKYVQNNRNYGALVSGNHLENVHEDCNSFKNGSEDSFKLHLDSSPKSSGSYASEETICLDAEEMSQAKGKDMDQSQEPKMQCCSPRKATDFSENSSLPSPDVGSDTCAMKTLWNFVME